MGEGQLLQGWQLVPCVQSHQPIVGQVNVLKLGEVLKSSGGEGLQVIVAEQQDACVCRQV